ncbi:MULTISPECIES: translation elongation factor Ts [Brevibacillus]|uniref:Elongation factor Ts n=1 Tax=Brevibacillus laterosporus TaxID=1465 RepID=A0AAP3DED1_BRELA|nr:MULTISPECIES: translation elongation factor Ts [Brevibacillus]MBG9788074.1 elongation factor Ts [Brevibacillus laterosporus]MCG7316502.1 translation elongation factor Ts [Brevibacillus laterosporus]MCR8979311.1 translation elongation factor Ts [Brevibacillus laterosporus]MCZ0806467.1 translation elongation factor Ts [Brevibacillus laterosporus]MCZ0824798.1 translation elongation factor Ts [Brevibacillus laterosporus]
MAITAQTVKELRERTGAGMMDCKRALEEVNGDIEKAIDLLREKGIAKAAKKSGRIAAEGLTGFAVNGNIGAVVEVNCETDFVAKNPEFQQLVKDIAEHVVNARPATVEEALTQAFQGGEDLGTTINAKIATIGENISFRRFEILEKADNGVFGGYLHMGGKIGALVALNDSDNEALAKDLAMHAAASSPRFGVREEVSQDVIDREREVLKNQALSEGKPANIVDKMVEGRMAKFFEEYCLVEQPFVKDPDKRVSQLLKEVGASFKGFARFQVGEGIEKKQEDFAAEVMAQVNKQ